MKYKCNLVVWQAGQNPVAESLFDDDLERLEEKTTDWMRKNNYQKANIHIFERTNGTDDWKSLSKAVLKAAPSLPEFAFLKPGLQDREQYAELMDESFIHLPTGRIIKMSDKICEEAYLGAEMIFVLKSKPVKMMASLIKLTQDDMGMLLAGQNKELEKKLATEFFPSFSKWFIENMLAAFKYKEENGTENI